MTTRLAGAIASALRSLPPPGGPRGSSAHVLLSGGVDSSVACFLLRERGWRVHPVLLRCWASGGCFEREERAAAAAVSALRIDSPLETLDLVSDYWLRVFEPVLLAGFHAGETPNPDVACNREVKFGAVHERLAASAEESGGTRPLVATGHYARVGEPDEDTNATPRLLRAADAKKDQTYFLAGVDGNRLTDTLFPLGGLEKTDVREIAKHAGLPAASARSSRGICFVGKQPLAQFLADYLPPERPGWFVEAGSGTVLGRLPSPAYTFTHGQRARIGGMREAAFVCGKWGDDVIVGPADSPGLFTREMACRTATWIAGSPPDALKRGQMRLQCKINSSAPWRDCQVKLSRKRELVVRFDETVPVVSPGQILALYDGEVCLGGGVVGESGVSKK